MGFKLAGYEVIGCCEIDPEMMSIYRTNHKPQYYFQMGVEQFKRLSDLPKELFALDILDGSPPCSTFSTAGAREKKWGKATHFREGQSTQILDDLFFHFIEVAKRLQPKVVVAENVKGLIMGNARGYVKQIFNSFAAIGYKAQLFLLNASRMGVPQRRERVFFLAHRADLLVPSMELRFTEEEIPLKTIVDGGRKNSRRSLKRFGDKLCSMREPLPTIVTMHRYFINDREEITDRTLIRAQTFPEDYNFSKAQPKYVCGMSVPPFMMQRIADQIWKQWLGPRVA